MVKWSFLKNYIILPNGCRYKGFNSQIEVSQLSHVSQRSRCPMCPNGPSVFCPIRVPQRKWDTQLPNFIGVTLFSALCSTFFRKNVRQNVRHFLTAIESIPNSEVRAFCLFENRRSSMGQSLVMHLPFLDRFWCHQRAFLVNTPR
jgi:hypothetical protein